MNIINNEIKLQAVEYRAIAKMPDMLKSIQAYAIAIGGSVLADKAGAAAENIQSVLACFPAPEKTKAPAAATKA